MAVGSGSTREPLWRSSPIPWCGDRARASAPPDAPSAATRERSDRRVRDPGDGMSWQLLVEFVVSIAYGVLSALVPIFNSEIYIVASQVGGFAEETTTAVGCAVGLSIGKVGTVLALRRGAHFRWVQRIRDHPRKPAGKFRTRLRGWSDRMFGLLGEPRWGAAIVFLSACVYVPPLHPVTLAVAGTRMLVIPSASPSSPDGCCCFSA